MRWPRKIVLVRHGESTGNVKGMQALFKEGIPNHNFPLTPTGKNQAELTGKYLRFYYGEFDAYFCSTFRRTKETLSQMYPEAKPFIDSRLNEMLRGVWNTWSKEQVMELYPLELERRTCEGEFHYRPFGGQSCQDVEGQIYSFLHDLRTHFSDQQVLVSGHGTWMLLFWRIMLNADTAQFEDRYQKNKYHNAALAVYEKTGAEKMTLVLDNYVP